MTYYGTIDNTVKLDELFAGAETPVRLENVSVKGGESFERGTILSETNGAFAAVSSSLDANKVLVIAAEDCSAESGGTVTSAYTSGDFHIERLKTGSTLVSAEYFKESLRQVNIHLTALK